MDTMFFGENIFFKVYPLFFFVVFFLVVGIIIFNAIKGISIWNKNNHSPILDVNATVVTKRTEVYHSTSSNNMSSHSDTYYYATFQVESGDRMEFEISGDMYGMLVEGDFGKLTFQGTRYLGFQR